jgi:Putative restriction endonuclease
MLKTKARIGPTDQGRRMPLKRFEFAEVQEGYRYELARGFIVVGEVPNLYHAYLVAFMRDRLVEYKVGHTGRIHIILGSMESKLLIPDWESERHPDLAIYLTRPRGPKNRTLWRRWIPEVVAEIVSPTSVDRDYVEKREEYWTLGVKEYWIVDAAMGQVLLLRRGRRRWIETALKRGDVLQSKLLPGFHVPCAAIFDAAGEDDTE